MKKVLQLFTIIAAVTMLASCASLPKKVKKGDSLVIGQVEVRTLGYENYEDVKFNGTFHDGIELTITDVKTNKEIKVSPDKEGYFYITGLKPHESYRISKFKLTRYGNSGASTWIEPDVYDQRTFIAYDNIVVNTGLHAFTSNWLAKEFIYEIKKHNSVKNHFLEQDFDSEWMDKEIVNQMQ